MGKLDKLAADLGLARRAGKLVYGYETVKSAVRGGKAKLVITASDFSPRAAEAIRRICAECGVEAAEVPRDMGQLTAASGKAAGVFALTDAGFAGLIKKAMQEERNDS